MKKLQKADMQKLTGGVMPPPGCKLKGQSCTRISQCCPNLDLLCFIGVCTRVFPS